MPLQTARTPPLEPLLGGTPAHFKGAGGSGWAAPGLVRFPLCQNLLAAAKSGFQEATPFSFLTLSHKAIGAQWRERFGYEPLLAETFTDPDPTWRIRATLRRKSLICKEGV